MRELGGDGRRIDEPARCVRWTSASRARNESALTSRGGWEARSGGRRRESARSGAAGAKGRRRRWWWWRWWRRRRRGGRSRRRGRRRGAPRDDERRERARRRPAAQNKSAHARATKGSIGDASGTDLGFGPEAVVPWHGRSPNAALSAPSRPCHATRREEVARLGAAMWRR